MRREITFVGGARPQQKPERDQCMWPPGCRRDEHSMGVCGTHYQVYLRGIKANEYTWADLIRMGWARENLRNAYQTVLNAVKAAKQNDSNQMASRSN